MHPYSDAFGRGELSKQLAACIFHHRPRARLFVVKPRKCAAIHLQHFQVEEYRDQSRAYGCSLLVQINIGFRRISFQLLVADPSRKHYGKIIYRNLLVIVF